LARKEAMRLKGLMMRRGGRARWHDAFLDAADHCIACRKALRKAEREEAKRAKVSS
jgi:hypothetical protein